MFWAENISRDKKNLFKEVEREKKTVSETQAKGGAKLVLADTKWTKCTKRMYTHKFSKEDTKSRKDKSYHEVTL